MKHFTQFIHLLRSAWDGDKSHCAEQVQALAEQLEGEGDTAHARMLRFTLQSLQGRAAATVASASAVPVARAQPAAGSLPPSARGEGEPLPRVELTFGSWDHDRATTTTT
jgi:hypothetical protein